MHSLALVPNVYLTKDGAVKQGSRPALNERVPKVNTGAMSSNMTNLIDPAVAPVVSKELSTSDSWAEVWEGIAMVLSEPSDSHIFGTEVLDYA